MRRLYSLLVVFDIPGFNVGARAFIKFNSDDYPGWYDFGLFENGLLCGWKGGHYINTDISGDAIVSNRKMTRYYEVAISVGIVSDFHAIDEPPLSDPYEDYLSNLIGSGHLNSSERAAYVDALNQYVKYKNRSILI